jgi:hypothetical protein
MNIKKFNKYVQKYKIQSMNIEVTLPPVGGLSSQIHMGLCILLKGYFSNHYNIYDIKQFKLNITNDLFNMDFFDKIYEYDSDNQNTIYLQDDDITRSFSEYIDVYDNQKNIKESNYLINLNKLRPNIQSMIYDYLDRYNINNKTLGIHIRLTDMNIQHAEQYGIRCYEDYLQKVKDILSENELIENIFISSDNNESIKKLIRDLPNIKINYIVDNLRCDNENSDNFKFQIDNLKNDDYVISCFIDIYLLSKCGYLVHRISGFSLCSILYSNTYKKTYLI